VRAFFEERLYVGWLTIPSFPARVAKAIPSGFLQNDMRY
jgi:hypothetical protein